MVSLTARLARRVRRRLDDSSVTRVMIEVEHARAGGDHSALRRLIDEVPADHPGASTVLHAIRRSLGDFGDEVGAALALTAAAGRRNGLAAATWSLDDAPCGPRARQTFLEAITSVVPEAALVQWERALGSVRGPGGAGPQHRSEARPSALSVGDDGSWSHLAVSGAGWSGSGAVFDHLRSHRRAVAVPGESRLLEGRYGFRSLLDSAEPDLDPHERLDLLRYCLLGFAPCNDWNDYRHVRNARRAATGPGAVAYATVCADVMEDLAQPGARALLPAAARSLFDASVRSQLGTKAKGHVPILDNVVHIRHLGQLSPLVPHVHFIAVVRDPRDQFVDNLHHNPRFRLDGHRFVRRYRHVRSLLETAMHEQPGSIRVVQFEEFVLDATARDTAVGDLVDRLGRPSRKSHFDPDRSAQNIGLWKNTRHEAIEVISSELGEFLVG